MEVRRTVLLAASPEAVWAALTEAGHLSAWLPPTRRLGYLWGPDDAPVGSGGGLEFLLDDVEGSTFLTVVERAPVPSRQPSALAVA